LQAQSKPESTNNSSNNWPAVLTAGEMHGS
jgi:hypothetical protein